ncbi:hypothetical protein A6R68_14607 [Neotoma lepida]|uniref:Secreted protein n=1 Tax=Neotoma lepida TaxID=56216 RepID=A0A1A6H986_NEOLE|nr:hypothetical protein A6R68_14607 [Neotoma lepida]
MSGFNQTLRKLPASLLCVQSLPASLCALELQACHMRSCEMPSDLLCACELQAHCVRGSLLPVLCVCACELLPSLCDLHLPVIRVLPALVPHPGVQTCHL